MHLDSSGYVNSAGFISIPWSITLIPLSPAWSQGAICGLQTAACYTPQSHV